MTIHYPLCFFTTHWAQTQSSAEDQGSASPLYRRLSIPHIPWQAFQIISSQEDGCHISALTTNTWICKVWCFHFKPKCWGPAWCIRYIQALCSAHQWEEKWSPLFINHTKLGQPENTSRIPQARWLLHNVGSLHRIYRISRAINRSSLFFAYCTHKSPAFCSKLLQWRLAPNSAASEMGNFFPRKSNHLQRCKKWSDQSLT